MHAFDAVDFVEFWRDSDGSNSFDTTQDQWWGKDEVGSDGWSVTRAIGGVMPGTSMFFARAGRYSFSNLHYSEIVTDTIQVVPAPYVEPVAIPLADAQTVASTVNPTMTAERIVRDAGGNFRVFYWKQPENRIFTSRFNSAGAPLTVARQLNSVVIDSFFRPFDVAMADDGSFAVAYIASNTLYVQWFSASGAIQGSRITVASVTATNPYLQAATDQSGNLLLVYNVGSFADEDVYAVSVARDGTITRAPWRVHTATGGSQKWPAVALNGSGDGIIAWGEHGFPGRVVARRISNYGLAAEPEFTVDNEAIATPDLRSVYVAVNSYNEIAISYRRQGLNGMPMVRRYHADGQPNGEPTASLGGTIALSDSGWLVSSGQLGNDPDGSAGVFAQLYDPVGEMVGPRISVPNTTTGDQSAAGVIVDADADFTVAWGNAGNRVYFRQFGVNLPPIAEQAETFTIAENSSMGTLVGRIEAHDPDGDDIRFALVGEAPFLIDPVSGELRVNRPDELDFESTRQYQLTIEISDDQHPSLRQRIVQFVEIANVNEPPNVASAGYSVKEHSPHGTVVGTVAALDPDGNTLQYALLGTSPFAIDPASGIVTVANPAELDFHRQSAHQLTVVVTDSGTPQLAAIAELSVTVLPDPMHGGSQPPVVNAFPMRLGYATPNVPIALALTAEVFDEDSANWDNGILRISIVDAADGEQLQLLPTSQLALDNHAIRWNGRLVGTQHNDNWPTMLSVVLNANATPQAVQTILRQTHFKSPTLLPLVREIEVTLDDGQGGSTAQTISVGGHLGDMNGDLTSDGRDFNIWNANKFTSAFGMLNGDANSNGIVDAEDFHIWFANRFSASSSAASSGRLPRAAASRASYLIDDVLAIGPTIDGLDAGTPLRRSSEPLGDVRQQWPRGSNVRITAERRQPLFFTTPPSQRRVNSDCELLSDANRFRSLMNDEAVDCVFQTLHYNYSKYSSSRLRGRLSATQIGVFE